MDVASRKKQGVERQITFGPSAPIDEWELEKATLLRELNEHKEKVSRLERVHDEQQDTFERNRASLLKEVKLKESSWEKRRQEADEHWMAEIVELQAQLENQEQERQQTLKELRKQMEHTMTMEQQKNERRVANLHERLADKERALQQYQDYQPAQPTADSPSPSPSPISPLPTPTSLAMHRHTADASPATIRQLKLQLEQTQHQYQQLTLRLAEKDQRQAAAGDPDQAQPGQPSYEALEAQHRQEQDHLRDTFMKEHQSMTIHWEARTQNMQNEYEDTIQQLRDENAAEKEVWKIEYQAQMDQLRHQLEERFKKQHWDADQAWLSKWQDLQSTLSQDAMAIQGHWETKIQQLNDSHEQALVRARSELDVVKDRLANDIDRRHRLRDDFDALTSKTTLDQQQWLQEKLAFQKAVARYKAKQKNQQDYDASLQLAQDMMVLLNLDEPHDKLPTTTLLEMLKTIKKQMLVLQSSQLDMEDERRSVNHILDFAC
ncbi:hypothetical protein DM01DRAFT_1379426 [Hesseltinella vesiculosa]|uniref:Uncharacterized protein n=1 Tax=Hesseltinella vesiculosa TaxID=101127 RepID=A0A1X2GXI8_9FUNG|nr:hypothetical protein DM01DRAFT_1379426 [Hesseltinella vesiculosa]